MNLINSPLIRGALAGTVATLPMTMAMTKIFEQLPERDKSRPLPPGEITAQAEERAGISSRIDDRTHEKLTVASHFGFGALCGVLYALSLGRVAARPVAKGAVFGLAVWGVSYLGFAPALGLRPTAWRESKKRNQMMIVAHLVWGISLARLYLRDTRSLVADTVTGFARPSKSSRWMEQLLT